TPCLHSAIHSCPTRRSSDLAKQGNFAGNKFRKVLVVLNLKPLSLKATETATIKLIDCHAFKHLNHNVSSLTHRQSVPHTDDAVSVSHPFWNHVRVSLVDCGLTFALLFNFRRSDLVHVLARNALVETRL